MTRPNDGTLASLGDNPVIEGTIHAALHMKAEEERAFYLYGDERADLLFKAAYFAEMARIAEAAARRAKRRADALAAGGVS